jgi:hypothetical protein
MDDLKLSTVQILFYKGKGSFFENVIRKWTKSIYAHTEFVRTDGYMHSNDRKLLISRLAPIDDNMANWDAVDIILPALIAGRVQKRQLATKLNTTYDWLGILLSQVIPLNIHNPNKWFCSKSNADDIYYAYRLMQKLRCEDEFINSLSPILKYKINEYNPARLYAVVLLIRQNQECLKLLAN